MSNGIPFEKFMSMLDEEEKKSVNLELSSNDKIEIEKMINLIKENKNMSSYEKGVLFENTIEKIFLGTKVFKCIKNKHTSSNEFDLLVKLNNNGKLLRGLKIIPEWIPDVFLIECKNHSTDVEVGLVGKFFSLMESSGLNLGLFISRMGVTGKNMNYWKDSVAFINKINLKHCLCNPRKILLDFNIDEVARVLEDDYSIVDLIEDRRIQIDLDINGELIEWINPHENAGNIGNILSKNI